MRLRALVDNTPNVAIQGYDIDGRVTFWNNTSEHLYGWSEEETIGRTMDGFIFTKEEADAYRQMLVNVYKTGTPVPPTEFIVHCRDGTDCVVLCTVFQISAEGKQPEFACMDIDITDKKRLEEQLAQGQRVESLGRLAGGIAHDFNNLLTTIIGNAELADRVTADPKIRNYLRRIVEASNRGAVLTQQILTYARKQVINPERVNINELLLKLSALLSRLIRENIEFQMVLAPDLAPIMLDPLQFDQVLINLMVNARDAMPNGGQLTVSTANAHVMPEEHGDGLEAGSYVTLTVTDTGCGIAPEYVQKIFEPFFTTKPVGSGTGLGLSTCLGIVKQNGGYIECRSEVGKGTSFYIHFPVCNGSEVSKSGLHTQPAITKHTVVLVEDEDLIRELSGEVLEEEGYNVVLARNSDEAIKYAENASAAIDILVTDVVMPKTSGTELAQVLRKRRPDLPVLLMSGYSEASVGTLDRGDPRTDFIPKPFTPSGLAAKVRSMLERFAQPR